MSTLPYPRGRPSDPECQVFYFGVTSSLLQAFRWFNNELRLENSTERVKLQVFYRVLLNVDFGVRGAEWNRGQKIRLKSAYVYSRPMGNDRTRTRDCSNTATLPLFKSASIAGRFARRRAICFSGLRSVPRRKRITDGRLTFQAQQGQILCYSMTRLR